MSTLGKRKEREEDDIHPQTHRTLFVSNIPYTATSTDLRTLFSEIAPVRSAFVVLDHGSGASKGVGYVSFAIKEDVQPAFDKISSEGLSLLGRALRVQWADAKYKHKEDNSKEHAEPEPKHKHKKEKLIEHTELEVKPKPKEDKSKKHPELETKHKRKEDKSKDHAESDTKHKHREDKVKEHTEPEFGMTLFVRNVPFTATDDELHALFRAFGPLRYARITVDAATGRSRGTGFACFWNKEDADNVVQQSEQLRSETMGGDVPRKNPFTTPSILTPDPSSTLAQNLVLHGCTLDVVRAVTREKADQLKEEGEKKREKADKRNIYLLREGLILPNTPSADILSTAEIEKRTSSYNARRALLRSNPSLYISRTRLSVRQIPVFVTERLLKRLATHAVRKFESEVKKGLRTGITAAELIEDADEKQGGDGEDNNKKTQKLPLERTGVKQAKIVRQEERVDPVTGKGRSKGYGFIEMRKHADALRVLRWSNNNPEVGPLFEEWWKEELKDLVKQEEMKETKDDVRLRRLKDEIDSGRTKRSKGMLIVEFSIENVQVVHRRHVHQREEAMASEGREHLQQRPNAVRVKSDQRSPKKRRVSEEISPAKDPEHSTKAGRLIGSLIGRKRKERRKAAD